MKNKINLVFLTVFINTIPLVAMYSNDKKSDTAPLALLAAAKHGDSKEVKQLLANKNIDVNQEDFFGFTPLYWAVKNGNDNVVKLLLDAPNIDLHHPNLNGVLPFFWAINSRNIKVMKWFLGHKKFDVNKYVVATVTPLYIAAEFDYYELAELLIKHKDILINKSCSGKTHSHIFSMTPLGVAMHSRNDRIVQLLIASNKVEEKSLQWALKFANRWGIKNMIKLLEEYIHNNSQ